jgi:two-component sensor histidine kinase
MGPQIELSFTPEEDRISVVRRFVEKFYEAVISDEDAVSRIAITAHELLENAAKYSSDGRARLRIELEYGAITDLVRVTLSNRANRGCIEELKTLFDEMGRFANAFAFYQNVMRRSAKRTEGSGLGLARILVEAEMKLSLQLDDDQVVLKAETEIAKQVAA